MSVLPLTTARRTLIKEREGIEHLEKALEGPLGVAFQKSVDTILSSSSRVIITGIGKSGHIGRKIQATLASTGTPAVFLHPAEAAHGDLGIIQSGDIIIALSHSGESTEIKPVIDYALQHSLTLIGVTSSDTSSLAKAATICLLLPPVPEACPLNLAPTTSSIMLLALGDALAMSLMEQRHFTAHHFNKLHPAGHIGARLRPVHHLMHTGSSMPLGKANLTLRCVIMEMTYKAFGCMGVIDQNGALSGLISDRDLRCALEQDLDQTQAADIMNSSPLTITPHTLVQDALHLMYKRDTPVSSVFILDDARRPLGILHLHDFLQAGVL